MVTMRRAVAALGLLAALTGCGGEDPSAGPRGSSSTAPPTASAAVSAESPAVSPTDVPTDVPTEVDHPVTDVLVKRYTADSGPDWMAVDSRGLWVRQDLGPLLLFDPGSGRLLGQVDIPYTLPLCQGVGAAYGAVWTCQGTDVLKVDEATMRVVDRVSLKKEYGQGHLATGFGRVWVLLSDGSQLVGIDPRTDRIATRFQLPARGFDLAVGEHGIWVACQVDDTVLEVDPESGKVLVSAADSNPEYVTVDDQVWVTGQTHTVRLDPSTGAVLATVPIASEPDGSIASDDHHVYVRNGDDFLVEIDKATGLPVARYVAKVYGGSVAVAEGDVWVTSVDDNALFRLHIPAP